MPRPKTKAGRLAHNAYAREWYKKNRKKHMRCVLRSKERYRVLASEMVAEFRSNGCATCPEREPCCLDAHHPDPRKKDFSVAQGIGNGVPLTKIQTELQKCICVCKNCHAKIHAGLITPTNQGVGRPHKPAPRRGSSPPVGTI